MKCLLLISCLFAMALAESDPNFYRNCMLDDFGTLWPDYRNRSEFYACANVGVNEKKACYPETYFRFDMQVCVWKWEWKAPPPIDQIQPLEQEEEIENDTDENCINCWYPECATEEDQSVLWPSGAILGPPIQAFYCASETRQPCSFDPNRWLFGPLRKRARLL